MKHLRNLKHNGKHYYGLLIFSQKQWFGVKNVLMLDLFQLLSSPDGLEWCGLLWCFYQNTHSDGTHSLQSIHAETLRPFLQTWWINKLIYISDVLRVSMFGWTIALSLMSYETAVQRSSALLKPMRPALFHKTSLPTSQLISVSLTYFEPNHSQ